MMTRDVSNPTQVDSLQKNRRGNMNRGKTKPLYDRQKGQKGYRLKWDKPVCTRCGNTAHNKDEKCPAIKEQCSGCKKTGHYHNMCFKAIKTVTHLSVMIAVQMNQILIKKYFLVLY